MAETAKFELPSPESAIALSGDHGEILQLLTQQTGASFVLRGQDIHLSGTASQVALGQRLILALEGLWSKGEAISPVDLLTARQALDTERQEELQALRQDTLARTRRGLDIRAKTFRQRRYVTAIRHHALTICVGPAGTGKTYLAAIMGIQALLSGDYERLVLTRPAVEAGERLGFLPGDLQEKVNPYLRPLYDALYDIVEPEKVANLIERDIIEIAPLAYMRGRTLNNAFVILDEAQNTTPAQMKMVLTRLGNRSRMVVTGDLTQTDLQGEQSSGLAVTQRILQNVEGIAFCSFSQADVVRHPLVQRIVAAYEQYEGSGGRTQSPYPRRPG